MSKASSVKASTQTSASEKLPRVAVGVVVRRLLPDQNNNRIPHVLLVKRGRPPHQGDWAIPGGKVQFAESLQQAAEREVLEETTLIIKAADPIYVLDLMDSHDGDDTSNNPNDFNDESTQSIDYHYVIIGIAAEYVSGEPSAHDDAAEAAWINEQQLDTLKLHPATRDVLQNYVFIS